MLDQLKSAEDRYEEISQMLTDPAVVGDSGRYRSLMKEYKSLTPIIEKYREYAAAGEAFREAKELLEAGGLDREFKEVVEEE